MSISKDCVIEKPIDEVFSYVRDFRNWPDWSPWLICERETKLTFGEDEYSWDGKVIGSGKMKVVKTDRNSKIDYALEFYQPWKSQADVTMEFSESGAGTKVCWTLVSKLPWFLFFLKGMMECMVGMDYKRGLTMLKERLETGKVSSELSFTERQEVAGCRYIGIERTCSMDDMERLMGDDFQKVVPVYMQHGDHCEPLFTVYNKWKMSKGEVSYIVCAPVQEIPADVPAGMVTGSRPACSTFAVTHTGAYHHLGNAWSAGMMRSRVKMFKQSKVFYPFEQYLNNPEETPEAELLTRVCLPRD
ncbi:MAG: SRPBCC family protein [Akkermansiaceae bacterium]